MKLYAFEHSKSDERFVQIKFEADNDELTIKIHDRGEVYEKKLKNLYWKEN